MHRLTDISEEDLNDSNTQMEGQDQTSAKGDNKLTENQIILWYIVYSLVVPLMTLFIFCIISEWKKRASLRASCAEAA